MFSVLLPPKLTVCQVNPLPQTLPESTGQEFAGDGALNTFGRLQPSVLGVDMGGGSSLAQAPFVAIIHPPKIDLGKGWYSIDEGVIVLNRKRRRCSPSTTVTS